MKYKENKIKFYVTLLCFALAGALFTTKIVSLNSLYIGPVLQLIFIFVTFFVTKKYFLTNKYICGLSLLAVFAMIMDLTNLVPAAIFFVLLVLHKLLSVGDMLTEESFITFFKLIPLYFLGFTLLYRKNLSLLVNSVLQSKKEDIFIENEDEIRKQLPVNTDGKEYDLITTGDIIYTPSTETISISAKNLENFIDFSFVLKDKRNSFLGLKKGLNIVTSKNCHLSSDGKFLFLEITQKSFFKNKETFVYVLYLPNLSEIFKSKIYQYLRFDIVSDKSVMVNEALTIEDLGKELEKEIEINAE